MQGTEEAPTEAYKRYAAGLSRASRSNERSDEENAAFRFTQGHESIDLLRTVSLSNGLSNGR